MSHTDYHMTSLWRELHQARYQKMKTSQQRTSQKQTFFSQTTITHYILWPQSRTRFPSLPIIWDWPGSLDVPTAQLHKVFSAVVVWGSLVWSCSQHNRYTPLPSPDLKITEVAARGWLFSSGASPQRGSGFFLCLILRWIAWFWILISFSDI